MRIDVIHDSRVNALAASRDVVIMAVRSAITLDVLQRFVDATNLRAEEGPVCSLTVFGERTVLPDPEILQAASAIMPKSKAAYGARVIPGHGLWSTALSGMANSVLAHANILRRRRFDTIPDAVQWLALNMGRDAAWRQQLTTLSGTLLYGSPSWNRASQMAPYLRAEGEDK
jgi:hypothetical protein